MTSLPHKLETLEQPTKVFKEESDFLLSAKYFRKAKLNNTPNGLSSFLYSPESSTSVSPTFVSVSGHHQSFKLGALQVSLPSNLEISKPYPTLNSSNCMWHNSLYSFSGMGPTRLDSISSMNNMTIP